MTNNKGLKIQFQGNTCYEKYVSCIQNNFNDRLIEKGSTMPNGIGLQFLRALSEYKM